MNNKIYKSMLLLSPVPYISVEKIQNKFYKFLDANDAFIKLLKVDKESILDKSINDLFKEEIRKLPEDFKKVNEYKYVMYGYIELAGNYYNVEVYSDEENIYHIMLIKINIVNNKLSNIIRKSPFISWIKDLEGRYIDVNVKFMELFKLKYEDIIGKTDYELWDIEFANEYVLQDKEVIKRNDLVQFKHNLLVPGKYNRIFETAKWPYTSEEKLIGVIGISTEITDKLKLKAIIEKSERNFLDMANNIDEVILIRDEEKALYISPYFEELYGFKADLLYDDISNWYEYWDKLEFLEEPKDYNYTDICIDTFRVVKEGKIDKWIQSKFVPIFDDAGNIIRKVGIQKDITYKKEIEDELENLRLEFFSNLSHELRTPINLIMSALQLIDCKLDSDAKESISKYFGIITQNNLRLLRLVNNLIDTTKINSGNFSYNPQNKDIISFIENISDSVVDFVEKNDIELIFDTDTEEKIIGFDLNHIERIMLNLISNAIKFNKPGGKIEININTEEDIIISVKDTGIGIPMEKVEKVFERFEQVNKHGKIEKEGSGIGLSLVKSLVEMHGGTINLKSKLYEGSEFIITLPNITIKDLEQSEKQIDYNINQVNKMEVEFSDIYY